MTKPLTKKQKNIRRAARLWNRQKLTLSQIAEKMGMEVSTIGGYKTKKPDMFEKRNVARRFWTEEEVNLLEICAKKHRAKTMTMVEIGEKFDRSERATRDKINKMGWHKSGKAVVKMRPVVKTGCHTCGAGSIGKYCEEHARDGFPKNMTAYSVGEHFARKEPTPITMPHMGSEVA